MLNRVQEVMGVILAHPHEWSSENVQSATALPGWLVKRGRALRDWLYWFEPEQRQWHWWSARIANPASIVVIAEVKDDPTLLSALEWLFKASGALRVERE